MALQLGNVIGKIGGKEVNQIDVDFTSPSSTGSYNVVTVPVPEGKTAKVVLVITAASGTASAGQSPQVRFSESPYFANFAGDFQSGLTVESTGPTTLVATRRNSINSYTASFQGVIYWWEV